MTSFFAVLLALVIEQLKPLPRDNQVHRAMRRWSRWAQRNLDAGGPVHAWLVWVVTVVLPALAAAAVHFALSSTSLLLALAFDVAVLYLTLGFRQFSHFFTDIREALERGHETRARELLAQWRDLQTSDLPRTELLRHVMEHALLQAHRHVFGVFFSFVVLSALGLGPAGAVLYRMAASLRDQSSRVGRPSDGVAVNERLQQLSRRAFELIDAIPARLTAFGFAVVGNFEEAINSWRRDASLWEHPQEGIVLAAAAGAVGVQLGGAAAPPRSSAGTAADTLEAATSVEGASSGSTSGVPAQLAHLQSMAALVWRSVVLWMLIVALLSLANVLGQ
jgi:adenosylcobinamide-phosphate synthase